MYILGLLFLIYILYTIFYSLLYLKGKNEKKEGGGVGLMYLCCKLFYSLYLNSISSIFSQYPSIMRPGLTMEKK